MEITVKQITIDEKEILKQLLEKYNYEFSQYDQRDVNKLGLYGYDYLDYYWNEPNRAAFFILVDGRYAGFVMISDYPESDEPCDYVISEFFVMYKYRKHGVGQFAAKEMFQRFKGKWQLKRHPKNRISVHFWDKVVGDYTKGAYRLVESYPNQEYEDGTLGDVYFFDNSTY